MHEHHADHRPDPHAAHGRHRPPTAVGTHSAHTDHTGHEALFRRRFWVCLVLSLPVLLYSPMLQEWLRFSMPAFRGSGWVAPVFAVVVFAYGGVPFLRLAPAEWANRAPGMMTLISLAITTAFVYSLAALLAGTGGGFFWELVTLIDVMLLGHWLEMRSIRLASGALDALARLLPDSAERLLPDGGTEPVSLADLRPGDLLLVRPGASIPADGEVTEGHSEVDESMVTGESRPVAKVAADPVTAGTINGDGSLRLRVTATGDDTALAGIMRLVRDAQQSRSHTQVLADRAAGWLFYVALAVAAVTAAAWSLATGFGAVAVERAVTVLVIACPHALGLAVPLVVAISTSLAAGNGILVRSRLALEAARAVDVVLFDKTGTLTRGVQAMVGLAAADGTGGDEALALAAAVEADSEHAIARAIRSAAAERALPVPRATLFEALSGRGVRASVDGEEVLVGGPHLLGGAATPLPAPIETFAAAAGARGQTVVYLLRAGAVAAAFATADVVRPESREAVKRLHEMGIEVAMVTGDSDDVARAVAADLGIDTWFAQVLPGAKGDRVAQLQAQGKRVAMVGDGINDAPALARADVGIAIGSGTNVAVESAGVILVRDNPLDVVKVIELSRATYRRMVQNLLWATGYNVVALPLAAGVLAPVGVLLSPAVGAILMSLSTVIVAVNAQLLRRLRL